MADRPDAIDAKHAAHEWAREIRRRPSADTRSSVKLIAAVYADHAALVTPELAQKWKLPPSLIGAIAAWPGLDHVMTETGQKDRGTIAKYLDKLVSSGDLERVTRRGSRLSSIYVLTAGGRRLGNRSGELPTSGRWFNEPKWGVAYCRSGQLPP